MLRFEGDREFARPPAEVYAKLTDVDFLVSCIPDVDRVKAVEAERAELVLRPGFQFVRGTLEVTMRLFDKVEPTGTRVQLTSKGIGSSSEVEASLTLSPSEVGTKVHWVANVASLGGLLKMVPAGLIRGAAEKVINDAWTRIAEKMSA